MELEASFCKYFTKPNGYSCSIIVRAAGGRNENGCSSSFLSFLVVYNVARVLPLTKDCCCLYSGVNICCIGN